MQAPSPSCEVPRLPTRLPSHARSTARPAQTPRVPRGQRRPGLRPHIPGPGTAGGARASHGGPGPHILHTLSPPGKALHNMALRTHPKPSAFPTPRPDPVPQPRLLERIAGTETAAKPSSRAELAPAPTSRTQPLPPPPLRPSPLPPEFWFELVSGSNHHIPQAAGAVPGAGAGAIPPGRVWEWGRGERAAPEWEGAVPGAGPPHSFPPPPRPPQRWNLPNYAPHPHSHPSGPEAHCKLQAARPWRKGDFWSGGRGGARLGRGSWRGAEKGRGWWYRTGWGREDSGRSVEAEVWGAGRDRVRGAGAPGGAEGPRQRPRKLLQ